MSQMRRKLAEMRMSRPATNELFAEPSFYGEASRSMAGPLSVDPMDAYMMEGAGFQRPEDLPLPPSLQGPEYGVEIGPVSMAETDVIELPGLEIGVEAPEMMELQGLEIAMDPESELLMQEGGQETDRLRARSALRKGNAGILGALGGIMDEDMFGPEDLLDYERELSKYDYR